MSTQSPQIFSIGHSTHSLGYFIDLLRFADISAIADVRSTPYSRHQPQFNREHLGVSLKEEGIAYAFLGRELGGRGVGPSVRDHNGRVQYDKVAETSLFHDGIKRLREGGKRMRIAMMCTEAEPLNCHRTILVSRYLVNRGVEVTHIHPGRRLESHYDAEDRLLRITGLHQPEMFRTRSEILEEAYQRQEDRVAYVARPQVEESVAR
jgi:uncharacterized protein (DUF488 family)